MDRGKPEQCAWTEQDQLVKEWGAFSVYDDPLQAFIYGTITSPQYLGYDEWERWKQEHYIGERGKQ